MAQKMPKVHIKIKIIKFKIKQPLILGWINKLLVNELIKVVQIRILKLSPVFKYNKVSKVLFLSLRTLISAKFQRPFAFLHNLKWNSHSKI